VDEEWSQEADERVIANVPEATRSVPWPDHTILVLWKGREGAKSMQQQQQQQ
jgi:hypothetical protein